MLDVRYVLALALYPVFKIVVVFSLFVYISLQSHVGNQQPDPRGAGGDGHGNVGAVLDCRVILTSICMCCVFGEAKLL